MKKLQFVLITLILLFSVPAFALPTLQLDISNGTYDISTETIVTTDNTFTLFALLNSKDLSDTYYISAAISPQVEDADGLGSFAFDGNTINTNSMTYGTPPLDEAVGDLAGHGIFPTYFAEFSFNFEDSAMAIAYNSQDNPGGLVVAPEGFAGDVLYYTAFTIDTTNLLPGYDIHFDLYNTAVKNKANITVGDFAPFSHDAQSSTAPVPEPATMLLLGTGLIGLAGASRKKLFKK